MIQETIYALKVLPPFSEVFLSLYNSLCTHANFSRGSIVLLSFLVFCQISKNIPFISEGGKTPSL